MRRPTLVLLALTLVSPAADAQQAFLGPGAAYISMGGSTITNKLLDERLSANGYPTFGQKANSGGIGGYRAFSNQWMFGAEITGLEFEPKPHNGREVGLSGGFATLGVGYLKQVSRRVRVYPRFGLGAGGLTLWIRSADTVTFDSVLASPQPVPGRTRLLSRDGGVIDLGGGVEFLSRGASGFLIGLRAGVLLASFGSETSWQLQNGTATNGPLASITGPYMRLLIGGAWRR